MRGAAATMKIVRPRDAQAAVRDYANDPSALPIAGGTDVMVSWNMGLLNGRTVLDLSAVREWTRIKKTRECLRVGALATHAELQRHKDVRRAFPLLVQACGTVGGAQIQNRGTLGGNIANASPAGDTFPPLAVYEAVVVAASVEGTRRIPFSEVFAGVKKTTLRPGELIEAVELPSPAGRPYRRLFRKVGTRAAQAISKTVAAGLLRLEMDARVRELRFALGSMAPTVRRLAAVEAFVKGRRLSPGIVEEACALLEKDVSPIDDIRSTRRYRLEVSRRLLRAFLLPMGDSRPLI